MCMCDVCVMIEAAWREAACHQNMNVCHYTRGSKSKYKQTYVLYFIRGRFYTKITVLKIKQEELFLSIQ